jgi:hypothetical protein
MVIGRLLIVRAAPVKLSRSCCSRKRALLDRVAADVVPPRGPARRVSLAETSEPLVTWYRERRIGVGRRLLLSRPPPLRPGGGDVRP